MTDEKPRPIDNPDDPEAAPPPTEPQKDDGPKNGETPE